LTRFFVAISAPWREGSGAVRDDVASFAVILLVVAGNL
jgi:hypothetical protein